eukprot:gene2518-3116_t
MIIIIDTPEPDPVEETRKCLYSLKDRYGNVHPSFREGSYNEVAKFAKSQFKLLLIYIHSDKHPDAHTFCRDVLFTEEFREYIDNNFVIWACDLRTSSGLKIANMLEAYTYPFLSLIACNSIIQGYGSNIRLENFQGGSLMLTGRQQVINTLTNAASTFEGSLTVARLDHEQREMDRLILQEQDEAYKVSLAMDQEKARLEKERLEQERLEKERLEQEEQKRLDDERLLLERKEKKKSKFINEPEKGAPNVTTLAIRLSDGTRLLRNFYITDLVEDVLDYIDTQITVPIENYTLNSHFPKKQYTNKQESLGNAGLTDASLYLSEI